jgi:hypothetical protein
MKYLAKKRKMAPQLKNITVRFKTLSVFYNNGGVGADGLSDSLVRVSSAHDTLLRFWGGGLHVSSFRSNSPGVIS